MSKLHKILLSVVAVSLAFAVIFGVVTRNSYKHYDADNAEVRLSHESTEVYIKNITAESVIKQLNSANSVFAVTVKESENIYQRTKTTVRVDRVIKGDESVLNSDVIIYEPNFFAGGSRHSDGYFYYSTNSINNLMQTGKQYLVFTDEMKYSKSYQETLDTPEYAVNRALTLYSFPLSGEISFFPSEDFLVPFKDIKSFDYICFSEYQKNVLDDIRKSVLDKYL